MINFKGLPAIELKTGQGARAVLSLFGGQLLSWVPAGGEECLYLSPLAEYDARTPLRGGVPVCFPQFAAQGPLPRHGLLRTRLWSAERVESDDDHALAVLHCTDNETSRAQWPHCFEAELSVAIADNRIDIEFEACNTGADRFSFTGALHTYLRVEEVEETELIGLSGYDYLDSCHNGERRTDTGDHLRIEAETDRIYLGVERTLLLRAPGRSLGIHATHFPDVVVWNPWLEKSAALPDLPGRDFRRMLCVEAAVVDKPIELAPGESWWGRQSLVAL